MEDIKPQIQDKNLPPKESWHAPAYQRIDLQDTQATDGMNQNDHLGSP